MKKFLAYGRTALMLGACFLCSMNMVQAKSTLTPTSVLKNQGVNAANMHIVGMSPDNRYLLAHSREARDKQHNDFRHLIYIFDVNKDNSLGKVRIYQVKGLPHLEQLAFAPDSNSVIIVGKEGTKYLKVDVQTGETTTIMEHVKGQPGFRSFPRVLTNSEGELLTQGYFYDEDSVCGPNTISVLDTNKTGVEAFTLANDIDKMQLESRRGYLTFVETYPQKDVGFMALNNGKNVWSCYRWNAEKGTKSFDKAQEILGFWGAGPRVLYSARRSANSADLIIYDGKTDEKIVLSKDRHEPYYYLFLSADGKTALFNDPDDNTGTTQLFYARESEGWKITPVKDLNKKIRTGTTRISLDGSRAIQHSPQGLRIIDLQQ